MPLVYSCVAEGQNVCNEASPSHELARWSKVVRPLLARIELSSRKSYEYENYSINYIAELQRTFLAIADKQMNARIVFAFLEKMRTRYSTESGSSFTAVLNEQMATYSDAQAMDKTTAIQNEIEAVKDIMMENISNVLRRGERMEDLVDKTDNIAIEADAFKKNATQMKKTMWWRNFKMRILIIVVGLAVVLIIGLIIYSAVS